MKFLQHSLLVLALSSVSLFAADGKLELKNEDEMKSVLEKQVGQVVELRLGSGEKIGGKVEKVNDTLVHLVQLTGQEFFDAVVDINSISAVVVRTKTK